MQPPLVREARPDDARRIAEVHVAGWRLAYRGAMPDAVLDGLSVEQREADHRAGIERSDGATRWWVAEAQGAVAGFAICGPCRDADADAARVGEVCAIYVDPAVVGTGTGRALMGRALEDLAARGFREATVMVLESNARARRFYERAGFALDGGAKSEVFGGLELRELRYRRALGA